MADDPMRIIFFTAAVAIGYHWRRKGILGFGPPDQKPAKIWLIAGAGLFVTIVYNLVIASGTSGLSRPSPVEAAMALAALDAIAIGLLLGYLWGDQQEGAERTVREANSSDEVPPLTVQSALAAIWNASASLPILLLCALGVVPATTWGNIFARIADVEAAGVKLTLSVADRGELANSIQVASRVGDVTTKVHGSASTDSSRRYFSTPRLDKLQSLTFPIKTQYRMDDPTSIILEGDAEFATDLRDRTARNVARDRSYMLMLDLGRNARSDQLVPESKKMLQQELLHIGQAQSTVLLALSRHVECVRDFVRASKDQRISYYEKHDTLGALAHFNRLWNAVEKANLDPEFAPNDDYWTLDKELAKTGLELFSSLDRVREDLSKQQAHYEFDWIDTKLVKGKKTCSTGTTATINSISLFSETQTSPEQRRTAIKDGGLSPYIAVLTAYVFSAVGSHRAALEELILWLESRAEAENIIRSKLTAKLQRSRRDSLLLALDWYRLQVTTELLVLATEADSAEDMIGAEKKLVPMVLTEYGTVLNRLSQNLGLQEWTRTKSNSANCHDETHRWRQPLIYSYINNMKQYLTLLVRDASGPDDINDEDLERAEVLAQIDFECFSRIFKPTSRLKESALAATTAAAVHLVKMAGSKDSHAGPISQRLATIDSRLRRAAHDLEAAQREHGETPSCYGRTSTACQALQKLFDADDVSGELRVVGSLRAVIERYRQSP